MGAKSSKTRPSGTAAGDGSEETTIIVTIVPDNSVGDDAQRATRGSNDGAAKDDDDDGVATRPVTAAAAAPVKVSKVQEVREARADTARQGSFGVRSVTASASGVALQLSSSEDSDAEDDSAHPERVRRRKKKRRKKRRSKPAAKEPTQEPVKPETSPTTRTSLRLKLNELRTSKKPPPPPPPAAAGAGAGAASPDEAKAEGGHFEQIKDAYSMEQPDSKEGEHHERRDSDATSSSSPRISRVSVVQLPLPSSQKQHPSPRQSTGSFFMSMVDSFQKPSFRSRRSNSSVVADSRYPSRRSPTPHTSIMSPLTRSVSSTRQNDQPKDDPEDSIAVFTHKQYDLDELDRETRAALEVTYNVYPQHRNQTVDRVSIVMQRRPPQSASPDMDTTSTSSTATVDPPPKTPRRGLNIDATDESVMDDILAELT